MIEVPFAIDVSEVEGGAYIAGGSLGFNWYELNAQTSGVVHLEGLNASPITKMNLLASDGSVIAQDILIPGFKVTLTFGAKATAQTGVLTAAHLYGAISEQKIAVYQRAKNHPRFAELETLYWNAKGWPTNETASERAGELEVRIAFDLMEEIKGTQ